MNFVDSIDKGHKQSHRTDDQSGSKHDGKQNLVANLCHVVAHLGDLLPIFSHHAIKPQIRFLTAVAVFADRVRRLFRNFVSGNVRVSHKSAFPVPASRGDLLLPRLVTHHQITRTDRAGPRVKEAFAKPLNRPRLRAGACSFPGFLPAAMFVACIWSTETYSSSLGYAKAGPRSGAGTGN